MLQSNTIINFGGFMRSLSYKGSLKKDIDITRKKFDFWKTNLKKLIFGSSSCVLLGCCVGIISSNMLYGGILSFGMLCSYAGINLIQSDKKRKKLIQEKENAFSRMREFSSSIDQSDVLLTSECLKEAEISKDYLCYKDKNGEKRKEEVRNYYVKDINGETLMLTEMRDELAMMIQTGSVDASLEITDESSFVDDGSYSLYLMDGYEYSDVETVKSKALILR